MRRPTAEVLDYILNIRKKHISLNNEWSTIEAKFAADTSGIHLHALNQQTSFNGLHAYTATYIQYMLSGFSNV